METIDFEQVYSGQWWAVEGETYQQCCDCGLTHRLYFRIRDGKIEMRADRDEALTRTARRRDHFPFKRVRGKGK